MKADYDSRQRRESGRPIMPQTSDRSPDPSDPDVPRKSFFFRTVDAWIPDAIQRGAPEPLRRARIVVGFAAESQDLVAAARRKLARKGCDLIVANDVSRADAGFDVDTNAVTFVWPGDEIEELPLLAKPAVAAQLLDRVEKLRRSRA